jgi:hypothetical protein
MKTPARFLCFGPFLSMFVASLFLQNANADSNLPIRRHEFARAFGQLPLSFEVSQEREIPIRRQPSGAFFSRILSGQVI